MLLSPLATPFQPAFGSSNAVVFNDGVPCMVEDIHDVIQGYQDETLDESFPPSAQEAAELEAVETFVDIMATLSLLEEREEKARSSFCHVKKRWEARRVDGLVGKPHPAFHSVNSVKRNSGKQLKTTDLVPFLLSAAPNTALLQNQQRTQARDEYRRMRAENKARSTHQQPRPLQQPRKMN
ncbi:expressed unknown protein [Seminavis robusta]|uniref:Uncharacterized protein n=1 Tax=Seminavis robusta TaxID=568900 RepID=A0A9N8EH79_9STRA|nr:expressed unknown protein [Seminavis robusta]|eukprot:Sro1094_g240530.1 n/a (181) ;mRNA; r:14355-14897